MPELNFASELYKPWRKKSYMASELKVPANSTIRQHGEAETVVRSASMPAALRATPCEVRDEVDEQLLPIFLEEADDLLPKLSLNLRAWREQPDDEGRLRALTRVLHTVKGSARMAGAMRIGEYVHGMEDRVQSAVQKQGRDEYWDDPDSDLDRIFNLVEDLRDAKSKNGASVSIEPKFERRSLDVSAEPTLPGMIRVRSDVIDRLLSKSEEVSSANSRIEMEMRTAREGLLNLSGSVASLRNKMREIEVALAHQMQSQFSLLNENNSFSDLVENDHFVHLQKLTLRLYEDLHDVQAAQQSLLKNVARTETEISAQEHLNHQLQQDLIKVRMVPFSSISERLYRTVRQTGKELSKRANLELSGTGVELDRGVLEKMTAPFEHLLRNAIAHGLETPEQRARMGKPVIGEIHLSLHKEDNELIFEFSDDGAGLDMVRLQQKALASGLLREGEPLSSEQAIQMIFKPGISTAPEVTEISGRGVGLDVVKNEVSALGGHLNLVSTPGKGICFTIHLPLTLAALEKI